MRILSEWERKRASAMLSAGKCPACESSREAVYRNESTGVYKCEDCGETFAYVYSKKSELTNRITSEYLDEALVNA